MNEIISGIRAVKMYAWEWNFRDIVCDLRRAILPHGRSLKLSAVFSADLDSPLRPYAYQTTSAKTHQAIQERQFQVVTCSKICLSASD
ncbi:hypothetical protein OS493_031312 [Desmophyllum pertusum]|uniref:Uncharacterized protein n=1 Tax=Desmophyllum pertusum TaxID=174260 RepID=A0A9W9YW53_9CNID|nr:hypothetical protein OS493_031312 [Desmophyllum pertusum]